MYLLVAPARSRTSKSTHRHARSARWPRRPTVAALAVSIAAVFAQLGPVDASTPPDLPSASDDVEPQATGFPPSFKGFPSPDNTGPRIPTTTSTDGPVKTTRHDAVIEGVTINGRLTIQHDNALIRDVIVNGNRTYMIHIIEKTNGECPSNIRFENVEINGENAPPDAIAIYGGSCGYSFNRGYIHNVGRGIQIKDDVTVSNSFVYASRTYEGSHRNAITSNGGSNVQILNNSLFCENTGCSAAVAFYGDFGPIEDVLVQGNLLATTGNYCMYGGSVSSKPYEGTNVRIIENSFSTAFSGRCGQSGPLNGLDEGERGNEFSGNIWHESGEPVNL